MKKTIAFTPSLLRTLIAIISFWNSLSLHAETPDAKATPHQVVTTNQGLIWKITRPSASGRDYKPSYLVGSIHLLRAQDLPYPASYEEAFNNCDHIWMELDAKELTSSTFSSEIMKIGSLPRGQTIQNVLTRSTLKKLDAWKGDDLLKLMFQKMKPWMIAITIASTEYKKMGAKPQYGVDMHYAQKAIKLGKKTYGLETVSEQLNFFDTLDEKAQDLFLAKTLDEIKNTKKEIKPIIAAWKKGDVDQLTQLGLASFEGYDLIKEGLLIKRNKNWITKIEPVLDGTQSHMIIVGALHLCGPDSVVELLKNKGYTLEKLDSPAEKEE